MATLCKNCGGTLIFDPEKNKMFCKMCGTYFAVAEVDIKDREILEAQREVSAHKLYGSTDEELMDCNVYTCNHCGGEIIINNTEVSTCCIYCGNPAVVFSRVSKHRRPEFILPFSVTQEEAVNILRMRLKNAFFVPKQIKQFEPKQVRGIYIPYWIVNAKHHNAAFLSGQVRKEKYTEIQYFERVGDAEFKNLTLDASKMLPDLVSENLEPFDLTALKPFDENYLSGFYSDMGDLTEQEVINSANRRCDQMYRDEVVKDIPALSPSVIDSAPYTSINEDKVYVMLPAWFITFEYDGKPLTVLINGDTGKLVGTFPFDKARFITLTAVQAVLLSMVFSFIAFAFLRAIYISVIYRSGEALSNIARLLLYAGFATAGLVTGAIRRAGKFRDALALTMSRQTLTYMKKRQG